MKSKELLYINNYNCSTQHRVTLPDNHMWGVDRLAETYDVTAARVPSYDWIRHPRIREIVRNVSLALRYRRYQLVYSACGELTDGFALMKKMGLWHGRLFKVQHHSYGAKVCEEAYEKIIYISPLIYSRLRQPNAMLIEWGGDSAFVEKCRRGQAVVAGIEYDFVSAGKSSRDYATMVDACREAGGRSLIITDAFSVPYDRDKVTVIAGDHKDRNSLDDMTVYTYCMKSRFIVIPCAPQTPGSTMLLAGLTSFADAVILGKPVLISDSTNMGVDVEKLGIGFVYRAGDSADMASKMKMMLDMSDDVYAGMCEKMREYACLP